MAVIVCMEGIHIILHYLFVYIFSWFFILFIISVSIFCQRFSYIIISCPWNCLWLCLISVLAIKFGLLWKERDSFQAFLEALMIILTLYWKKWHKYGKKENKNNFGNMNHFYWMVMTSHTYVIINLDGSWHWSLEKEDINKMIWCVININNILKQIHAIIFHILNSCLNLLSSNLIHSDFTIGKTFFPALIEPPTYILQNPIMRYN